MDENEIKTEKDGHGQIHRLSFLLFKFYGCTVHPCLGNIDVCIAPAESV